MWPMLLDFTRDECKRVLRKLELEAYASVISAFRAQGELSKEKKRMLHDLSSILGISLERHRAEVRRAVNDEQLYTIADRLSGPNSGTEWAIEGRRLVPLMPRLVPQTAFTAIANSAATAQAAKNASLPIPSATGLKENSENENVENIIHGRKRSASMDLGGTPQKILATDCELPNPFGPVPSVTPVENIPVVSPLMPSNCVPAVVTRTVTLPAGPNPMKITLTTASHRTTSTISTTTAQKQVIFMSTSSTPTTPPNLIQRSISVPIVKTVSTSATSNTTHQSKPMVSVSGTILSSNTPSYSSSSAMCMDVDAIYSAAAAAASAAVSSTSSPASILSPTSSIFSAGGFTHTISTSTAPTNTTLLTKSRSKASSVPRQPAKSKSNPGSVVISQTAVTCQPGLLSHMSVSNAHTVSPISKARSPVSRTPSPGSAGHMPRAQSPAASQALPIAQSPGTTIPSLQPHANHAPRAVSPVAATSQSPVSAQSMSKTAVSPKSLNKSPVNRPQPGSATRTLLSQTPKAQNKTFPPISSGMTCTVRPPVQTPIRTSAPIHQILSNRPPVPQSPQPKVFQGSSHAVKTTSTPPRIQYNTESGLKIITQSIPSSRILPKPPTTVSAAPNLTSQSNRVTPIVTVNPTGPSSARFVSVQQQPLGTRMTRAIAPSAITAVGLPGLSTTALRVTLPAGALGTPAVVRATTPGAKPNVILVHKAQLWSQSQGATIVMSSSGPMSRIPAEAVQEAVSFFQRQDRSKPAPSTVTLVKQVPVSQTTSLLSTSNVISSTTPISVCTTNNVSVLQQPLPAESSGKNQSSTLQTQDKPVDSDGKNTLLQDLAQLAGIVPGNIPTLAAGLQPVGTPAKSSTKMQQNQKTKESFEKKTKDDNLIMEEVIEDDEDEVELFEESSFRISETKKCAEKVVLQKPEFLTETSLKSSIKPSKDDKLEDSVPIKITEKSDKSSVLEVAEDGSSSSINIQDINLDQLPEGQILELQAQDAAELLSQHGQLSNEVLELLQQAGLQVHQVEVEDDDSDVMKSTSPRPSECTAESPVPLEGQSVKPKGKEDTEPCPQTGTGAVGDDKEDKNSKNDDESMVDIFSTALASAQLDLHSLDFVGDISDSGNVSLASSAENGNLKKC